jgi:hypothetical protein
VKLNIGKSPASIGWRKRSANLNPDKPPSHTSFYLSLGSYSHSAIAAVIPIPVVVLTSGIEVAAATQSSVFV